MTRAPAPGLLPSSSRSARAPGGPGAARSRLCPSTLGFVQVCPRKRPRSGGARTLHPKPSAAHTAPHLSARRPARLETTDPTRTWASARGTPLTGARWAMAFRCSAGPDSRRLALRPAQPAQPRRGARWDLRPADAPPPHRPLLPGGANAACRSPLSCP